MTTYGYSAQACSCPHCGSREVVDNGCRGERLTLQCARRVPVGERDSFEEVSQGRPQDVCGFQWEPAQREQDSRMAMTKRASLTAAMLLLAATLPALAASKPAAPPAPTPTSATTAPTSHRAPCQSIKLPDGSTQPARKLESGSWSTTSCELQVTVRLTGRVEGEKGFAVQPGATSTRCTVWVNDENGVVSNVPAAWDACVSAMLEKAEEEGERR